MSASRKKDQTDYDLERIVELFDAALTSKDERVIDALRSLLTITVLTLPEDGSTPGSTLARGPLKRIFDELHQLDRRISEIEYKLDPRNERPSELKSLLYHPDLLKLNPLPPPKKF